MEHSMMMILCKMMVSGKKVLISSPRNIVDFSGRLDDNLLSFATLMVE